jgi:hypothetical protein
MLTQSRLIFDAHVYRGTRRDELVTVPSARMFTIDVKDSLRRNPMYSRTFTSAALIAAALSLSSFASAQSITSVEEVMVGVSMQTNRLDTALSNLGQIEKGLHGADAGRVSEIAKAGRQFTGAVGAATPVSLILRHMQHPDDARFTRAMLAVSARKAVLAADADTEIINRCLPRIAIPEAAAESTKIRDAIVETRNLLEVFAHTPEFTAAASP